MVRSLGGIAVLARMWASSLRTLDVRQVREWFWEKEGTRNEEHCYVIPDDTPRLPGNQPGGAAERIGGHMSGPGTACQHAGARAVGRVNAHRRTHVRLGIIRMGQVEATTCDTK